MGDAGLEPAACKRWRMPSEGLLTLGGQKDRYSPDTAEMVGPMPHRRPIIKFLRKINITDRRKVVHSIRHSVKQALRDVGCPNDVPDAIQGHSSGDVAEIYGSVTASDAWPNGWRMP